MKIGVFSKIEMCGGSEFRCAELVKGICKHSDHEAFLLVERNVPEGIRNYLGPELQDRIITNIFQGDSPNFEKLYEMDEVIVVNTDSRCFTTLDYWVGKSDRHSFCADVSKIKSFSFLFNFIISPGAFLPSFFPVNSNIKIIAANKQFFKEVSEMDKFINVRHLPRLQLNSPIDPTRYSAEKSKSVKIRLGMHSKRIGNKWNPEWGKLIEMCNERFGITRISFDFMGASDRMFKELSGKYPNVILRKENDISVREYLSGLDIFVFFTEWKQQDAWSRVVAEAMISGCPVITGDNGGNRDQIVHGNTGFLCKDLKEYFASIVYLIEHTEICQCMAQNARRTSKEFETSAVIKKLIDFVTWR